MADEVSTLTDNEALATFSQLDGDVAIDLSPDRPVQAPRDPAPAPRGNTPAPTAPAQPAQQAPAQVQPTAPNTRGVEEYFDGLLKGNQNGRQRLPNGQFAPATAQQPTQPQAPTQQPAQQPGQFNYADFPPHEAAMFQQMSHQARDYFSKLSRQVRNGEYLPVSEVQKRLDAAKAESARGRWFDHENGYALNPEYLNGITSLQKLESQETMYQDALANIYAGKAFQLPERDAQGNVMLGAKQYAPDPRGIAHVTAALSQLGAQKAGIQQQLLNVETQHKTAYGSHINAVTQFHNEMFAEHEKSPAFKQATDQAVAQLPGWLKHMPEARSFAAGQVLVGALMAMCQDLKGQLEVRQNQVAAPQQGTVPTTQLPAGTTSADPGTIDDRAAIQEFARMKLL